MKSFRMSPHGVATSLVLLLGSLIAFLLFLSSKGWQSPPKQTIKRILKSAGFSDNMIRFWTAVSDLETATWTSNLYVKYHNMFGMKHPSKRLTTSIGVTSSGFASYGSDEKSVQDLVLYLDEFNYPKDIGTVEEFVMLQKEKGYFQEDYAFYLSGVKSRL